MNFVLYDMLRRRVSLSSTMNAAAANWDNRATNHGAGHAWHSLARVAPRVPDVRLAPSRALERYWKPRRRRIVNAFVISRMPL